MQRKKRSSALTFVLVQGCRKGFPQGEKYVEHHGKNYHAACSPKAAVCHECKKLIEEGVRCVWFKFFPFIYVLFVSFSF